MDVEYFFFQIEEAECLENVKALIDKCDDIDVLDNLGFNRNILHTAISFKRSEVAIYLIGRGININQQDKNGFTPLHFCVEYKNAIVAKELIQKGANGNIKNKFDMTPFEMAEHRDLADMVQVLKG